MAAGHMPVRPRAEGVERNELLEAELRQMIKDRAAQDKKLEKRARRLERKQQRAAVPVVDYNPEELVEFMRTQPPQSPPKPMRDSPPDRDAMKSQPLAPYSTWSSSPLPMSRSGSRMRQSSSSNRRQRGTSKASRRLTTQEGLDAAIQATKAGDADALFQFFMSVGVGGGESAGGSGGEGVDGGLGGGHGGS